MFFCSGISFGQQQVLISMDGSQTDHLKAYGIIFNHISDGYPAKWLLNYKGGSFLTNAENDIVRKSRLKNVAIQTSAHQRQHQLFER